MGVDLFDCAVEGVVGPVWGDGAGVGYSDDVEGVVVCGTVLGWDCGLR